MSKARKISEANEIPICERIDAALLPLKSSESLYNIIKNKQKY